MARDRRHRSRGLYLRSLLLKSGPKIPIGLVANKYSNAVRLVHPTAVSNIDTKNCATIAEVIAPHPQTTAAIYANL